MVEKKGKKKFLLALRNGINKLSGKQSMIDEYEKATDAITSYYDKMKPGKAKDDLKKAFEKLDETEYTPNGKGGIYIGGFNQYKSNKKILKQKIEQSKQIMQQFGITR